ncbi:MAG: ribosomal protein [Clostridia bacterium]|jgi:large subunit ribosomal protein L21|nr:ribosomal protein [Clostridia bacterium]
MYAIVEISGKQYKVSEGDIVFVDRIESLEPGSSVEFDKVLLLSDDKKVTVGEEYVKGAKVKATVVSHGKDKKVLVYKYKAKKNERKTKGHRQPYTKVQIEKITATSRAKKEKENEIEENA